ncbi:hypothetical protein BEL04_15870 [Mucilaginibacter sp. PPCGB 2223]|uniref:hypothetical protein n=1 Tax=Mucilaginibacter sp. PPCGB 2223 TaxID=1886027 RepID=UPI000826AEAA|nr:hypothetical protein [Mucilaginibacter sp. PPCGB 2223]OCX51501.1 hypothetical protein BEL04_15870 [Mucilaginibacter sp. PPCGB 2223]
MLNKNYSKWPLAFVFTFGIVLIILTIYSTIISRNQNLEYQFNGRVDSVYYTSKGEPYIFVKKVKYYLSDRDWDFNQNRIQKGDSVIKKKNSMIIKLFKSNAKAIIEGGE